MAFRRDKVLQAAQKFAAKGDFEKAIREYQSLVEHDPSDIQSWLMLADSLHRAGDLNQAVERWVHAAELHLHAGDVPQALAVFRQVLDLAPERYDVHLRTAQAFEDVRRMPEAVALYERVAAAYLRGGNTREALILYERVADLMPRDVPKRLRLGELYSREKQVDAAVQHFQLGADLLWEAGRAADYIRVAERLLYHRAVDHVLHQVVRAYLEIDQPRRALMKLNELLQRQSGDAVGLELLAQTFVRLGKPDKAISVVVELARTQRDGSPEARQRAFAVVCQAARWAPQNSEIARLVSEYEAAGFVQERVTETEEIDEVDAEEIEEFDEVEDFEEEPAALEPVDSGPVGRPRPVPEEVTRSRRLTDEVLSDGAQRTDETEIDFDRQFEEVRVLMKYHLFDHALGHLEAILGRSPNNQIALDLFAEVLTGLDRVHPAADVRAKLAGLQFDSDPQAAARQIEFALSLVPNHERALELAAKLAEISGVMVQQSFEDSDPLGEIEDGLDIEDEEQTLTRAASVSGAPIAEVAAEPSYEDPFGDLEGPLSPMDEELVTEALTVSDVQRDALDGIEPELDDADGIDIRNADPNLHGELNRRLADDSGDFAISLDSEQEVGEEAPIGFEDRFGLDGDDEDDEDDEELEAEPEPEPELEREPEPEPEPPSAPVDVVDLSGELDELEFFLAQDLEEDALAAYEFLVRKFPGHPELAKIGHRFPSVAAVRTTIEEEITTVHVTEVAPAAKVSLAPEPDLGADAAAPLLDLDDTDEDDDFLAGIFEAGAGTRKARSVAIQTHEVEGADAGDHFDLGTAYREMGLVDDALREYGTAAKDPRWQAKSLVMMAALLAGRGESDAAVDHLQRAASAARTKDERCEANYELAMNLLALDRNDEARAALQQVDPGFRDRDTMLAKLS